MSNSISLRDYLLESLANEQFIIPDSGPALDQLMTQQILDYVLVGDSDSEYHLQLVVKRLIWLNLMLAILLDYATRRLD